MARTRAVLFDLNGTLAYVKDGITHNKLSEYLFSRGYEVSPQQLGAAFSFVSFIDYPRHGYRSWHAYLSRVLWRLKVEVDRETMDQIIKLLKSRPYRLYQDAKSAVPMAKNSGFKTAVVTSITYFRFKDALLPIRKHLDLVMTGFEAGCDKSNPRMYQKVLQILGVTPQQAVMIGDELELDLLLPKRLGIDAILLNRKDKNKGRSVDAFVYDLNEAMETIIDRGVRTEQSS